jgi:BirA family transcriptional regulator, biotin operon repressor / biotin---[acetyl-CoA-carboxylase] ligase
MIPRITGTHIIRLDETDSTHDYLVELLKTDHTIESGTLVATGYQKKGRGFGDHTWESEPGKIFCFHCIINLTHCIPNISFILTWPWHWVCNPLLNPWFSIRILL